MAPLSNSRCDHADNDPLALSIRRHRDGAQNDVEADDRDVERKDPQQRHALLELRAIQQGQEGIGNQGDPDRCGGRHQHGDSDGAVR